MNPLRIAKFLTALTGVGAQVVASGLVDSKAEHWINIVVAVITAIAVYLVPNQEEPQWRSEST